MKIFFLFAILFLSTNCNTYDNAIIYHRNFVSGTNPFLKFDGYYGEENGKSVKPVFFYSNGSVFSTNNFMPDNAIANLVKTKQLDGAWGNYLINGDSIQLEKFQLLENNYERIILKGIISENKIHWMQRKEHNEDFKPVDYSISYTPFAPKPDSTLNFTRIKKKYNKIPLQ